MKQERAIVLEHYVFQDTYRMLRLAASAVGPLVHPGQFLHLRIPRLNDRLLRRPFSIYEASKTEVAILYKPLGRGTEAMCLLEVNDAVDIIGPLGNGFPEASKGKRLVLVAGGYGSAALYLQAKKLQSGGVAFFGGRTARDILCIREFKGLGWEIHPATDDGSLGIRGPVTGAFDSWMTGQDALSLELFSCGPNPLLKVLARRAIQHGFTAWLSLDNPMACGVGACLTCVIRRKTQEGWEWARCCKEGPVFEAREILWDE